MNGDSEHELTVLADMPGPGENGLSVFLIRRSRIWLVLSWHFSTQDSPGGGFKYQRSARRSLIKFGFASNRVYDSMCANQ